MVKHNFFLNFYLILSDLKVSQNQLKDVQGLFLFTRSHFKPVFYFYKKELNCIFFYRKNLNNRQLNNKNSGYNFGELSKYFIVS